MASRVRWVGSPAGLPIHEAPLRWLASQVPGGAATVIALWAAARHTGHPSLVNAALFASVGLACTLVVLTWELIGAPRAQRRTEYRITTGGVVVTRGSTVKRYALPAREPVPSGDGLAFGDVAVETLARDGRAVQRWNEHLVLSGLGARAEDVRRAIAAAREEAGVPLSAEKVTVESLLPSTWGKRVAFFTLMPAAMVVILWPALLLVAGTLLGLVGACSIVGSTCWWLATGWHVRRSWRATHPPLSSEEFAARVGTNARLVDEVREYLAHARGIAPETIHPEDTRASIAALGAESLWGPAVVPTRFIISGVRPEDAKTVGELVRKVDAELAKISCNPPAGSHSK